MRRLLLMVPLAFLLPTAGACLMGALATVAAQTVPDPLAPIAGPQRPPAAPVHPVTDTLFGRLVTDDYRYMEALDSGTVGWMKAQGAYTRAVLDAIGPRAALARRVAEFTGSFGVVRGYVSYGGRAFYLERTPGCDDFDLVASDATGTRKIVDVAAIRAAHGGTPYAINYFLASPDGAKVAVGISAGGSDDAALSVYDGASGQQIAGPVDRAMFGTFGWSSDSRIIYFTRLKQLAPGESPLEKQRGMTAQAWDLVSDPVPVAGAGVASRARITADEIPVVGIDPGATTALLASLSGVQELKLWTAPVAQASDPDAPWKLVVDRGDGVTGGSQRGDELFLLSHKDAPTFQVLRVRAGAPLDSATVLVPARADRVIEFIYPAADALYVLASEGAYSRLLRVPASTRAVEEIPLPGRGHVASYSLTSEVFTDPREPGIVIKFSSWVTPPVVYRYDPATKAFTALGLGHNADLDPAAFVLSDLEAPARDGVRVPLSLIQPQGAATPQIVLLSAYGSYGASILADFSAYRAAIVKEGISRGICHVRGGGELGEAWRLGGKDANKHNSWQDLIACGEYLIAKGITTREKLFILGTSAGGITVGRALTERPDLFAGVIDEVPVANTLRMEFSPNGPPNVPEFGSVATEEGFRNLYEMDPMHHVRPDVTYPAVMITTGMNDPRVSPWEPAKFAAALQASGASRPVLLRIDPEAGHGGVSSRTQYDEEVADEIAFILWRAGVPGWRPDFAGPVRIGTYDSRSVAVAFAGSPTFDKYLRELDAEHARAKVAHDDKRAAELEADAVARQQLMHMQGFCTAPVTDILGQIQDKLPTIKENAGVSMLISKWDSTALARYQDAQLVDVTMALVDALNPHGRSREWAIEIQKSSPLPLNECEKTDG